MYGDRSHHQINSNSRIVSRLRLATAHHDYDLDSLVMNATGTKHAATVLLHISLSSVINILQKYITFMNPEVRR
jgi:hypothetical protein